MRADGLVDLSHLLRALLALHLPLPELPVLVLPVLVLLVLDQAGSRRATVELLLWPLSARWVVLVLIALSSSIQYLLPKKYWFLIYIRKKLGIDMLHFIYHPLSLV